MLGKKPAIDVPKHISLYDGEITFTDKEIGKLLKTLKLSDLEKNTLVVVTSDHGEGLWQHGQQTHALHIYEEVVRVPLIFSWPRHLPEGRVFSDPVEAVDVVPTILDLIDITPESFSPQGRSLAPVIRGEITFDYDRPIYLYRCSTIEGTPEVVGERLWVGDEKFCVRKGKWKYTEGKEEETRELFDLNSDPGERDNLIDSFPGKADELSSHLDAWYKTFNRKIPVQSNISSDDLKRLKALGYIN
jgi:arylsulfatase A-like enzyme